MILSDLVNLYELKRSTGTDEIAERFWRRKTVGFEVVLAYDGTPLSCSPLLAGDGNNQQTLIVPDVQRRSDTSPFFLVDDARYIFGLDEKRGDDMQQKFKCFHNEILALVEDEGARAFLRFVNEHTGHLPDKLAVLQDNRKTLIAFRLEDDTQRIHERSAIHDAWNAYQLGLDNGMDVGICMVTGERAQYAKLFPQVTGLSGGQSSGASLVSLNISSFSSYGQPKNTAGAISRAAADKAGAALIYVLKSPSHRVSIGGDVVAFWAEGRSNQQDDMLFASLFGSQPPKEDVETREAIQAALINIRRGKNPLDIPSDTPFHVLGIAPYQARLAIRFYESCRIGELMENIELFLRDTEMVNVKPCSIRSYLEQTAAQGKSNKIPSTLITSCFRAMVSGFPFPRALFEQILLRMRVDHGSKNVWDMGQRAAILRACLLRWERARVGENQDTIEGSITVSLNEGNTNEGYLLGRLFALLEKLQADAIGTANASIRDRYMGAAATTPSRVFPQLMNLATHHIKKSDFGMRSNRKIEEVMSLMSDDGFPATLSYEDQGRFYIGYYQQMADLYKKREQGVTE